MVVAIGIIVLIIVLSILCTKFGSKMFWAVALSIVGMLCGACLAAGGRGLNVGEKSFELWFFALGGEILSLYLIGYSIADSSIDIYSKLPKIINIIGAIAWIIGLYLLFSNKVGIVKFCRMIRFFGIKLTSFLDKEDIDEVVCFACLLIAPYLIVATLDVFFISLDLDNSLVDFLVAMVLTGIAKISGSFLLYSGDLEKLGNIHNEFYGKLIAYIIIVSLLVILSFIIILKPAFCAIGNLKKQRQMQKEQWQKQKIIQEESKRKQIKEKYSYRLISAVEENDAKTVAALIEKGADVNYKDFSGKVPLRIAMENDNKNMISLLLEKGANIECEDNNGCRPLQNAVENGNLEMVSFLLEKGAFINCKDSLGQTPLLMALRYNNKNMISLLLEKGAAINIFDSNSKSALDFAIENEDADLVSLLLEKGAEIGDSDSSLKTALEFAVKNDNADLLSRLAEKAAREDVQCEDKPILFFAIEKNYKKLVELLIEKGVHKKSRFDNEDFKKITPLFFATLVENKDMVSLLIKNKVDVNEKVEDSENKDCFFSPLERALGRRNKEIASILLENGADINCCNCAITPLRKAIHENDKDMATFLLEKGANINYIASYSWVDNNGNMSFTATALSEAVKSNNEEMVAFLIERGADVNLEVNDNEEYYYTMLQEAVQVKNKKIISLLLDAGADINKNSQKNAGTALINSVDTQNYEPEIVSFLVERGADVNLESAFNSHTPLTLAVSKNNKDAVLLLLKHGADPNKKSSKLGTPLMVAFIAVNREMISLLMKNGADSSETFIVAAAMPKPDAAQFLLDNGADVNCEYSGQTPLLSAICLSTKEMVLFLISNGADVNHKCKNGNTPLLFAARHQRTKLVPLLKEAGAVSNAAEKSAQTTAPVATSSANFNSSENSADFNAALVALSKIIAKNGAEIFSPENNQKLKAFVSDLIPQENEIAQELKQALSCDFAQIILDATDKSDKKKENAFKKSVANIAAEAGLEKEVAVLVVKLVALALDWNLENLNLE